jgi:hypothetical protein
MPVAKTADGKRVIRITPLHVSKARPLAFPTIITQFEDKYTPEWKAETVYGRMDPFAFYAGTRRSLSLGFRIISDDETEAKINMGKLQKLIQYQYPRYQPSAGGRISTLKAPPYFSVEIMNIARSTKPKGTIGLQGYFSSALTINPGFQDKTKAQYFDKNFSEILYTDIEIKVEMVILHTHKVGFYEDADNFAGGNTYPYSVVGGPARPAAEVISQIKRSAGLAQKKAKKNLAIVMGSTGAVGSSVAAAGANLGSFFSAIAKTVAAEGTVPTTKKEKK